jgi:hypothetical protein
MVRFCLLFCQVQLSACLAFADLSAAVQQLRMQQQRMPAASSFKPWVKRWLPLWTLKRCLFPTVGRCYVVLAPASTPVPSAYGSLDSDASGLSWKVHLVHA